MSSVAILGYHRVGPPGPDGWETWFQIPEGVFAGQLAALREAGYEALDAAAFLRGIAEPERLPERAALITFDDGHRSVREVALPLLREAGLHAVLFMPSDFVGRVNEFDQGNEPEEPLCDWDDLRELARSGVSVQSHGASHRGFSELSAAERREELVRSKATLEAELAAPVEMFAFPLGDDADGDCELGAALEDAGYRAAFGYGGEPFSAPGADPYRLPRVAMGADSDLRLALAGAAEPGGV
jgi:peptidoglycan/xylan/chitin deacetylase (PgdA/CDA1 family)